MISDSLHGSPWRPGQRKLGKRKKRKKKKLYNKFGSVSRLARGYQKPGTVWVKMSGTTEQHSMNNR